MTSFPRLACRTLTRIDLGLSVLALQLLSSSSNARPQAQLIMDIIHCMCMASTASSTSFLSSVPLPLPGSVKDCLLLARAPQVMQEHAQGKLCRRPR